MKKLTKRISIFCMVILVGIGSYSLGRSSVNNSVPTQMENKSKNNGKKLDNTKLDYKKINKNMEAILSKIKNEYLKDYNLKDIEEGIYKGMLASLKDPYSVYYNEKEYQQLNEHTSGEFGGVGIQVNASKGDLIEVIAPIKGTPGEKAGILPGDKISKINDKPVFSKDLDEAIKLMRGKPGTKVKLTILRGEGSDSKTLDFDITRDTISVESVHTKLLDNGIGYLQITGFQEKTAQEFAKGLKELKDKGAKKLILDLRNNPGGLLNVTMDIANILMDEKVVINVKNKSGQEQKLSTKKGKDDILMVVLINKGSASASEVLSGALQDNGRAKIVGETSFGKGVIQNVYPFDNDGTIEGLKLTTAQFFTPNHNKIHDEGIKPDYEVKIKKGVTKIGVENIENDAQLQKAMELLK